MNRSSHIRTTENGTGLSSRRENTIIRAEVPGHHFPEEVEGLPWKLVLGEAGDDGAPSRGALLLGFVESSERIEWELGFGIEVDEIVSDERDEKEA